ncbi:MAG: Fic family protein [Rhodanobacteraceae bacterium]
MQCYVPESLSVLLKKYANEPIQADILAEDIKSFSWLLPCLAHDFTSASNVDWLREKFVHFSSGKMSIRKIEKLNGKLRGLPRSMNDGLRSTIAWVGGPTAIHANYVPPSPDLLPGFMKEFVGTCNNLCGDQSMATNVIIFAWFLLMHPFEDGNGRTSRVIFASLCRSSHLANPSILLCLIWMYRSDAIHFTGALQKICVDDDWTPYLSLWSQGFDAVRDLSQKICCPEFLAIHSLDTIVRMVRNCK